MTITPVLHQDIDKIWLRIKTFAEGAAEYTHGRFTANDIRTRLKASPTQQLWLAHDEEEIYGFVVTQPSDYPQMRVLMMHFTGGKDLPLWKDAMLKVLQEYARNNGCEVIESLGRNGWGRVFKEDGYKSLYHNYELPVGELQ